MRRTICDCCGTENGQFTKIKIPIITQTLHTSYLSIRKMDVCIECANRFADLYYKICNEHGRQGMIGINMCEEDEE